MVKTPGIIEFKNIQIPKATYNSNYVFGDCVIRIKNAYRARHQMLFVPNTKMIRGLLKVLQLEGYIASWNVFSANISEEEVVVKNGNLDGRWIEVVLRYTVKNVPALIDAKIYSKPGKQFYVKKCKIPSAYRNNFGILVISTSKGIMSHFEAFSKNLGGKILAEFI